MDGFLANTNTNTGKVQDKIFILPCLQELKQVPYSFGSEREQQPGIWDESEQKMKNLINYDGSDFFDQFWWKNVNINNSENPTSNQITKNDLLVIPNFDKFKPKSPIYNFRSHCKTFNVQQKWAMYTKFFCEQFNTMNNNNNNTVFIVTHHNRMRSTKENHGLLPLNKNYSDVAKLSYPNIFCLKIDVTPSTVNFEIVFQGFPDQGNFYGNCNNTLEMTSTTNFGGGIKDLFKSTKSYNYICNTKDINITPIREGILEGNNCKKNMTIYVIRHGNSLHNQPTNLKNQEERLDSSLTPLGFYQAKVLSDYIMKNDMVNNLKNSNIILCTSFLERTQLTGLLLLENLKFLNKEETPLLLQGKTSMKEIANKRFAKTNQSIDIFKMYSPIGNDDGKFNEFKNYIRPSYGGKKKRSKSKKRYRKKQKKTKKIIKK
jgi:bisphosphoglycerate-dependent phosphoglycerate mutase